MAIAQPGARDCTAAPGLTGRLLRAEGYLPSFRRRDIAARSEFGGGDALDAAIGLPQGGARWSRVEISPIVPPNRLRIFVASTGSMSPEGCSMGRVCSKLTRNRK